MTLNKVNYKKFILPIVVGLIIWFLAPIKPAAVSLVAWHMLAIFIATILACITQPLPIAGSALIGITLSVLLGVVKMEDAASGFGNDTVWMIGMAYFLSRGFINTGLGRRIALIFVRLFGKRTLGLSYALIGVDLVTAPATPSNTARAGGIVMPIIESLSETFGSSPKDGTQSKIGSYLMFTEFHGDIITSGMFMTAMAPNLVAVALAKGMHVQISWMGWFIAALVPGIICLLLVPWLIYKMYPPEIKETPNAKEWADKELAEMGKMSLPEKIMASVFVVALLLWMISSFIGLEASTVAFLAVVLLLLTGVLSTKDILNETGAWNTIIWFSILIFMANELNVLGFIPWLSKALGTSLHGMSWEIVLVVLVLFYFYSHYLFASGTAHVTAMYGALLAVAISAGAPATFAAMILGFTGAIFGSTTQYANGPASALFGAGYNKQSDWWRLNFVLGLVYIVIWGGVGSLWMKVLGMW
ncbi:anion permease [Lactobacillus sp. LC28-10]|uniref:Anion permease n=1 Tax=Secundilactobacillus angelensis TaxID=2722706 RepID=A0ABX1KW89_9LACO|nr:anion permease [Secundilactobacillus angelensis]MCH5461877.1 anion permease [Secundilactobacillus angelensis]NLR17364.1 anion permease [Secundilactobacillus angelensis]